MDTAKCTPHVTQLGEQPRTDAIQAPVKTIFPASRHTCPAPVLMRARARLSTYTSLFVSLGSCRHCGYLSVASNDMNCPKCGSREPLITRTRICLWTGVFLTPAVAVIASVVVLVNEFVTAF